MAGSFFYLPLGRVVFGRPAAENKRKLIAEGAMHSAWVRANPQPITSSADVMRLLEAAF